MDTSTNTGLYRRVSEVVRSRIPRATHLYLTQPQPKPDSQPPRSRSSSESSGSTEEIGRLTRPASPQPESIPARDINQLQITLPATSAPSNSSVDLAAAEVGYQLCSSAQRHALSAEPDAALLRHMHVDAIYYLSRALPQDLTSMELEKLGRGLPQAVIEQRTGNANRERKPTLLRRITAQSTALMIGWIVLLVPLLVTILNSALAYERRHHLTERGFSIVQETYTGIARHLRARPEIADQGSALGACVASLSFWIARIVSEVALGAEEGWDRVVPAARGQVVRGQDDL